MLYCHVDSRSLLPVLHSYLPYSLPVYNCLLLNDPLHTILTSFDPAKLDHDEPFVILVDLGHQLRFFCSLDGPRTSLIENLKLQEVGAELVVESVAYFVEHFAEKYKKLGVFKLGGINSLWLPFLDLEPFFKFSNFQSCVLLSPEVGLKLVVDTSSIPIPDGLVIRAGKSQDLAEIMKTLKVDHSSEYLLSRLPHSTLLFSDSTTLVGHCITHLDGSIGTLFINSDYRGKRLGKILVADRMSREERRSYSYVDRDNLASLGVFKSLDWTESWDCSWVSISML